MNVGDSLYDGDKFLGNIVHMDYQIVAINGGPSGPVAFLRSRMQVQEWKKDEKGAVQGAGSAIGS